LKGRSSRLLAAAAVFGFALTAPAAAQPIVTQSDPCSPDSCQRIDVDIQLSGGRSAKLSLLFEHTTNLSTSALRITAEEVQPDDLLGRLPAGVYVNPRLPLRITIDRPTFSTFVFRGLVTLDLHTDAIDFEGEVPTDRLFQAATSNLSFVDLTRSAGLGSYRMEAGTGTFGELLVVNDLRPKRKTALLSYLALDAEVTRAANAGQITGTTPADLHNALLQSRTAFEAGNLQAALDALDAFADIALTRSGTTVANTWDPSANKISEAGILRGAAGTLRLQVELASRPQSQAVASVVRSFTTAGGHRGQVTVSFPKAVGNVTRALGITATDVDRHDPALLARIPDDVSVPAAFPVLVHIGPGPSSRLTFAGAVDVEMTTRELDFLASSPLRLFKAEDGGTFEDITDSIAVDSYRARGKGGSFSDFMILIDRRNPDQVITGKFDALAALLAPLATGPTPVDPPVHQQLTDLLQTARTQFTGQELRASIDTLDSFVASVEAASGSDPGEVQDVFRQGDRTSAAGGLTAGARSLQLALTLQASRRVLVAP
jgi:hypothetical protein